MERTKTPSKTITLAGVVLAVAALVFAVAAVAMTAGSITAQTDPKPCGPGNVPSEPDATITSGHYAVFDGYWDKTLELNLCPPAVVHTMETQIINEQPVEVEVSTRTSSNVDIQRTVFHIEGSGFEHTLTPADLEEYDFFKVGDADNNGVDDAASTTVWWLKVDDPDTPDDEDSDLAMGFSAALFHSDYWYLADGTTTKGAEPLQYEFEVIREPGIPIDEQGHVFAFDDSDPVGTTTKTAYWDSSDVDARALPLYPGEYHHLQWAFTKPGTYVISVQLKGHVRTKDDRPEGAAANWKPISEKIVETSEVRQYVFQIGALTLNEEPAFEVERSVQEHSAIDTQVGDPIPVYQGDDDDLTFTLTGPGHSLFSATSTADGNAQIKVADVDHLDYEVRSQYRLTLGVRDNKDHERNTDERVDGTISVKINVTDRPEEERSVAENSAGGTLVGDAIVVAGANATTTYTLSGNGSDLFTVENSTSSNAQIKVAAGAVLNYEDAHSYVLSLNADTGGNTQDVRVTINVLDDPNEQLAITLTAEPSDATQTVGSSVVFTGTVTGSPVATSLLRYGWSEVDQGGGNGLSQSIHSPSRTVTEDRVTTRQYTMRVWHSDTEAESNPIVVDWQAASQ